MSYNLNLRFQFTNGCFKASSGIIRFSGSHLNFWKLFKKHKIQMIITYSKHLVRKSIKFKSASLKISFNGFDSGLIFFADLVSFNNPLGS
jgi:hypothetical protein